MKLAVVNAKGGAGKTTTAVYLAAILANRGADVQLVDADPQASAAEWLEVSPIPGVEVLEAPSERLVARVIERARWRHVVIDSPPGHERLIRAALDGVDTAVIPTRAGGVEISRVQATLGMVPAGVTAGLALTCAEPRTIDFRTQIEAWIQSGVPVWGVIPKRVAIARGPDAPLASEALDAYREVLRSSASRAVA